MSNVGVLGAQPNLEPNTRGMDATEVCERERGRGEGERGRGEGERESIF